MYYYIFLVRFLLLIYIFISFVARYFFIIPRLFFKVNTFFKKFYRKFWNSLQFTFINMLYILTNDIFRYFEVYCGDLSRKCLNICELNFLEWGLRKNI